MTACEFILFYFGSQAFSPEDAHVIHRGSAAGGAAAGWLIGTLIERMRAPA